MELISRKIKSLFLRVLTALLLFNLSCGYFQDRRPEELVAVEFEGPWEHIDLLIHGQSIYEPVMMPKCDQDKLSSKEKVIAVYNFMKENFVVWNAPLIARDLETYLYGFGYGLCGRESTLMTSLWYELGLESRSIHWGHHVMAEVKVEGNYCLFDAQHHLDFGKEFGIPTSIQSLQENGYKLQDGFDDIGYSNAYLNKFYSHSDYTFMMPEHVLAHPELTLSKRQRIIIRKRPSIVEYSIPLSVQFNSTQRSHLVSNYEVELLFEAKPGEVVKLDIDLPFLRLSGSEDSRFKSITTQQLELFDIGISELNTSLHSIEGPFHLVLDAKSGKRKKFSAFFLMAGWLGDRFFSLPNDRNFEYDESEQTGKLEFKTEPSRGRIWVESLKVIGKPGIGDVVTLELTLAWENLASDIPVHTEIFVDALKSKLPFEVYEKIGNWNWSFDINRDSKTGKKVFHVDWLISEKAAKYRDPKYRTLIGHVKGTHIDSGQNCFMLDFECIE